VTPSPPDNEPPDASNDTLTLAEDSGPATINVLANDSDPDGDLDPPIRIISGPSSGQLQVNAQTGDITYTPAPGFSGTVTVVYEICDDDDDCSTATLTIIVTPVPEPPIAVDDFSPTLENTPVIIPVLNNDSDPDGDPLTVTAVVTTGNGTAVINPNYTVTYTPALNFEGVDIFTYTISDGLFTDMARVTVTITPTNSPPVAQPDGTGTAEDTAEIIQVLANDTDPDGDPLTVIAVGTPISGTATTDGNVINYVPFPNAIGTDVFTYTISDSLATSTAAVTIVITNSNDLPQAVDDAYTGSSPLNQPASGVLGNDNDPDGDALTALLVTPPVTGTLVLNSDGSFVYTVAASGTYTFTYQAQDNLSSSNSATVFLTVP
jgi:large repetitive protein